MPAYFIPKHEGLCCRKCWKVQGTSPDLRAYLIGGGGGGGGNCQVKMTAWEHRERNVLSILRFWRRMESLGACRAAIIMANFLPSPHFDGKFGSWSQLDTVHYTLITICSAVIVMCDCKCKCKPTCSPLPFRCGKKDCFCTLPHHISPGNVQRWTFPNCIPVFLEEHIKDMWKIKCYN